MRKVPRRHLHEGGKGDGGRVRLSLRQPRDVKHVRCTNQPFALSVPAPCVFQEWDGGSVRSVTGEPHSGEGLDGGFTKRRREREERGVEGLVAGCRPEGESSRRTRTPGIRSEIAGSRTAGEETFSHGARGDYAAKLAPQPHVSVALGFSNVKPRALSPSW